MRDRAIKNLRIRAAIVAVTAAFSLNIGACSSGDKSGTDPERETAGSEYAGQETSEGDSAGQDTSEAGSAGREIPETGSADREAVLKLSLPEDESLFSHPVRSEDDGMIQIQFGDQNTRSEAIVWASLEKEGGPSEYYVFDEEGEEKKMVAAGSRQLEMVIRKTVENSDIHGILVSWECDGVYYELWEDDAREQADDVIQTAAEIAARSME